MTFAAVLDYAIDAGCSSADTPTGPATGAGTGDGHIYRSGDGHIYRTGD